MLPVTSEPVTAKVITEVLPAVESVLMETTELARVAGKEGFVQMFVLGDEKKPKV